MDYASLSGFLPLDDRSFLKVGGGQTKREVAKFSARDACSGSEPTAYAATGTGTRYLPDEK
jgi:hypothetical protein